GSHALRVAPSVPAAKPAQIVRPPRLRPRPRQSFTAERLRAHYGADLVAVDIDVAAADAIHHVLHPRVDSGVKTKGQSVTARIDVVDHPVDLAGIEACHVQNRPEHFPFHIADPGNPQ